MAKIKVDLKEKSYDIIVGANHLLELGKILEEEKWGRDIFIVTDPLVNALYGDTLRKGLKQRVTTIEMPRGERYKNLKTAAKLYDELIRYGAHRDSLMLILGGGVVGDLAGFVAATFMRGINYVQVPTTLLAQVDAAIGGKTAVNHPRCKNLIGCFFQPKMVFIDVETLTTLPARELHTGLAEVVKYGVIEDADFFKFLAANAHHLNTRAFEKEDTRRAALKLWQTIVFESVKIKTRIVEKDEKESGLRKILNFGHTIGHAVETLTRYRAYNHGEAVSIGMVAVSLLARRMGMFDAEDVKRIKELLEKLSLPVELERLPSAKIFEALTVDKKIWGGKIQFVLPEKLGKVTIRDDVSPALVKQVLKEMGVK
jgi:3-dehydroquinate synthase